MAIYTSTFCRSNMHVPILSNLSASLMSTIHHGIHGSAGSSPSSHPCFLLSAFSMSSFPSRKVFCAFLRNCHFGAAKRVIVVKKLAAALRSAM